MNLYAESHEVEVESRSVFGRGGGEGDALVAAIRAVRLLVDVRSSPRAGLE